MKSSRRKYQSALLVVYMLQNAPVGEWLPFDSIVEGTRVPKRRVLSVLSELVAGGPAEVRHSAGGVTEYRERPTRRS